MDRDEIIKKLCDNSACNERVRDAAAALLLKDAQNITAERKKVDEWKQKAEASAQMQRAVSARENAYILKLNSALIDAEEMRKALIWIVNYTPDGSVRNRAHAALQGQIREAAIGVISAENAVLDAAMKNLSATLTSKDEEPTAPTREYIEHVAEHLKFIATRVPPRQAGYECEKAADALLALLDRAEAAERTASDYHKNWLPLCLKRDEWKQKAEAARAEAERRREALIKIAKISYSVCRNDVLAIAKAALVPEEEPT